MRSENHTGRALFQRVVIQVMILSGPNLGSGVLESQTCQTAGNIPGPEE